MKNYNTYKGYDAKADKGCDYILNGQNMSV